MILQKPLTNGARLAGGHLNDSSQKDCIDNLSRRPGDSRISSSGFSGETLVAIPAATSAASAQVRSGRYCEADTEQVDSVMLLKGNAPTVIRPEPAILPAARRRKE